MSGSRKATENRWPVASFLAQPINPFLIRKPYSKFMPCLVLREISGANLQECVPFVTFGVILNVDSIHKTSVFLACFVPGASMGDSNFVVFVELKEMSGGVTIRNLLILLATVMLALANMAGDALASDNFPGTTISGTSGSFVSSNVGTTGETGEPASYGTNTLNTMWYSWTAPATGTLNVQTCSSTQTNFDTTLQAFTGGAVNALTLLAQNDDNCANSTVNPYASAISFPVVSGTTYRIQVDGFNALTGSFYFAYSMSPIVLLANTTNGAEATPTNGVMTVTQSATSATATVISYTASGTATSGSDYTALSGSVTIPIGATTATITIPVINDVIVEGSETVIITLTGITSGSATLGGTIAATNTIADNDAATVSIANTTNGAEAGPVNGVMTLTQTLASATNSVVSYTVSGTATSGVDYTALSGSVTIPAGSTTATISIPVLGDLVAEGNETVIVTLSGITGLATLGTPVAATNTITDNGVAAMTVTTTDSAATETAGDTGAFTVVLKALPTATVTVTIGTSTQCTFAPATLTFTTANWNVAQTVTVTPNDDAVVEGPHTCSAASISAANGGYTGVTATPPVINITDNDSATVSIANITNAAEPTTNGVVRVTQTAVSATNTVINLTIGGIATSGTDYTALPATVTILAGATTADISIAVIDDVALDPAETVTLTLASIASGLATLGAPVLATNTITDNEVAAITVNLTDSAATETAGNTGAFTLVLTAQPSANVTVTIGTSTQCTFAASTLTFTTANWNVAQTVTVTPNDDAVVEGPHTCSAASISAANGGFTGVTAVPPVINITDNDSATVSIANITNAAEPATNGVVRVTQTAVSATNTVINLTIGGTATSGTDYAALPATVIILAGSTTADISIVVIDDLLLDAGETVTVTLASVASGLATLGAPVLATNTIADNDVASFTIIKGVNAANIAAPVTLTYTITVANTGNIPLTAPIITDALSQGGALTLTSGPTLTSGDAAPLGTMNVGETWVYTATYAVTQGNINNGATISNTATFDTAETAPFTSSAALTTITLTPAITVVKSASTAGPVAAGNVITYTFLVANTGNVTLSNSSVSDTFNGYGLAPSPGNETLFLDVAPLGDSTDLTAANGIWTTLAPGDKVKFTGTYTVVQQDVDLLQ